MSDRANVVLADVMEVRRADKYVALVLTVSPERIQAIDPREPVVVMGLFSSNEHVERIEKALGVARRDTTEGDDGWME